MGCAAGRQSAITSVIRMTLIWPKEMLARIGSNQITDTATMPAASQHRRSHGASPPTRQLWVTSSRVSTIQVDTTSSTQVVAVMATPATGSDTSASGPNMIAASGG